jgi:hypothetical protein
LAAAIFARAGVCNPGPNVFPKPRSPSVRRGKQTIAAGLEQTHAYRDQERRELGKLLNK